MMPDIQYFLVQLQETHHTAGGQHAYFRATDKARSLTEQKGLGKEIWHDVDVRRDIDEERGFWR